MEKRINNFRSDDNRFQYNKTYNYLRTPTNIWEDLKKEFNFTIDVCASDRNHLLERYYTKESNGLTKDWSNEIAYIHPMFDTKIGKWVEKAFYTKNFIGVFLLPASTHTKYFHDYCYNNSNCEIRFLRKPVKGFHFGCEDGTQTDPNSLGYLKPLMIVIFKNGKEKR
jgi:site-specific DNA-methyltransferase (adenine-specific)|tara:strand:+ start:44 stop:544 length:501 start_codon:yes stop_codon:yes gene_type:complete